MAKYNSQEVITIGKTKRCKWCFTKIDETTGYCSKQCKTSKLHQALDEAKEKVDEEKENGED